MAFGLPAEASGDADPEILDSVETEFSETEFFETEMCVGCGLTVAVDSPVFLEWDADLVGWSTCPDCRAMASNGDPREPADPELHATPRRAA